MLPGVFTLRDPLAVVSQAVQGSTRRGALLLGGLQHLALAAEAGHGLEVELRRREGPDAQPAPAARAASADAAQRGQLVVLIHD